MKQSRGTRGGDERTIIPTTLDIAWAAGIYEGEGTATLHKVNGTAMVRVTQAEPWLVLKLYDLFGGSMNTYAQRGIGTKPVCEWYISQARARGFAMTIYKFLSPHKQKQLRTKILGNLQNEDIPFGKGAL